MAADLSHSSQIERSWHLLTVLVRLGRPAHPAELASRCNLSPPPSPDLVELLSSIPGSPLLLTDAGFVTVSEPALAALVDFVSAAIAPFVPRVVLRASARRKVWGDLPLIYVRKRKAGALTDDLAAPSAKRRLFLSADAFLVADPKELGGNDGRRQLSLLDKCLEVPTEGDLSIGNIFAKEILSVGAFTMGSAAYILKQESPFLQSLSNSIIVPRSIGNIDHCREKNETEACDNTQAIVVRNGYNHGLLGIYEGGMSLKPSDRVQITEPDTGPAPLDRVLDEPILQAEACREEKDFETAASFDAKDRATSAVPPVVNVRESSKVASAGTETGSGDMARITKNIKTTGKSIHQEEISSTAKAATRNNAGKLAHTVPVTAEPTSLCKEQSRSLENSKNYKVLAHTAKHEHEKNNIITKQKMKKSRNQNIPAKENGVDAVPKASKSCLERKSLPDFESFTVEEEEGSGGYGTVYRARRKDDGKTFAIKCPHANANSHHINNEMKMLERLGGRNFVIKYEGSFKSGDLECFVLEHVEHDRPEVLKKEIDVFELQWYGYCMFRALASLHKQGIVHRDVKPGNFLFSRKHSKGYLIDFNLANDLHKKVSKSSKSQISSNVSLDPLYLSSVRSSSYSQARKLSNNLALENVNKEQAASNSKKLLLSKNMKKRPDRGLPDSFPKIDNKIKYGSQAADVSGVTSAKDPTSTRTLSADRLKQPIPMKGRKELINFVQEAMQSPSDKPAFPVSQRKRIAAPSGKVDRRLVMLTPMPLRSGGSAVAGAGMHKSQGNEKHKREGPCVGTKGFRAPEVLFKSFYQGCKVDIWSAGVTLLYMMIGRAPFGGDPEQNIKEIAKLRGSEDLWEVAKLHNCESHFPEELFDVQSIKSMDLRDWCIMNTKRPDFLDLIPRSLFDLIEKCLTVNPRRRINSEEAIMHDFFTPCHESLRKQRLLRRTAETGSSLP